MPQKKTAAELAELADAAHERVVTWCLRNGTTLYPADRHRRERVTIATVGVLLDQGRWSVVELPIEQRDDRGRVRYAHRIHDNRLTGGDQEQ